MTIKQTLASEYQKQRRRIMQTMRRARSRGYEFDKPIIPPKPKHVTEASIRRLSNITPDIIYSKSSKTFNIGGQDTTLRGIEARSIERSASSLAGAATKRGEEINRSKLIGDALEAFKNRQSRPRYRDVTSQGGGGGRRKSEQTSTETTSAKKERKQYERKPKADGEKKPQKPKQDKPKQDGDKKKTPQKPKTEKQKAEQKEKQKPKTEKQKAEQKEKQKQKPKTEKQKAEQKEKQKQKPKTEKQKAEQKEKQKQKPKTEKKQSEEKSKTEKQKAEQKEKQKPKTKKPKKQTTKKAPEKRGLDGKRKRGSRRKSPDDGKVILKNVREMIDKFWDNPTQNQWEVGYAEGMLDDAIDLFGEDELAKRLEGHADEIYGIMDTIMNDSDEYRIQRAFNRLQQLLYGEIPSVVKSKELEEIANAEAYQDYDNDAVSAAGDIMPPGIED